MSTYTVSLPAMQQTGENIASIASQMTSLLNSMSADAQRSLASWTGDAQASYAVCKSKWDAAAAQLPGAVSQAQSALEQIAEQYGTAENAAVNMFPS